MKFMTLRKAIFAVVTIVLLGGIGSALWLGTQHSPPPPINNVQAVPETVMFVPHQAPFMASLLVNVDHLKQAGLAALSTDQRRQVQSDLGQLHRQLEEQLGLDYDADIAPWAGEELTIALTSWDIDRNPDNGATPGFLLAVSVWDAEQANASLQRLWQRQPRGTDLVTENYSGVTLVFPDVFSSAGIADAKTPAIATAQVGQHYVLLANSPNILRNAVNTLQVDDLSLGKSPLFQNTVNRLPQERIGLVWINQPTLKEWMVFRPDREELLTNGAIQEIEDIDAVEIIAVNLAIAPRGIVADTVITPSLGTTFREHIPHPVDHLDSLAYMPADSSLVVVGHALSDTWSLLNHLANQGNPLAQHSVQALATQLERRSIPVNDDVLPWADGDYALALMAPHGSAEASVSGDFSDRDWVLVIPSSEENEHGIQQLDAIAQDQGFNLDVLTIGDHTTSIWTRLQAVLHVETPANPVSLETEVLGIHGQVQGWDILATSVRAIGKALVFQATNLAADENLQAAIAALEPVNDGYLYVDGALARTVLADDVPALRPILDFGKPVFRPVRSLLITRYESQPDAQRFGLVMQF